MHTFETTVPSILGKDSAERIGEEDMCQNWLKPQA